ncbi:DedA family protein [Pseudarthrobacter sp. P1]|uniref:DedA family protein n=1 Tax=Pseudarthrobacter sp. P1 TaxID=3418418 RepID=UPI003CFA8133
MHQLNELITHSANQWWVVPMVTLFCLIDGFFLFLPSETAIVALSAISIQNGLPNVWLLLLGGAVGAILGDNIAYFMGRKLGTTRFKWMRRPRAAKAFDWAKHELNKRGAVLVFTARYIPVGRIAVNFTAGATGFSWRRFFVLDFIAAFTWSAYGVAIGSLSGSFHFLHDNPLTGIGIAIVFAIVMGFAVDHAMKWLHGWLDRRARGRVALAAPAALPVSAGLATGGPDASADSSAGPSAGN